MVLQKRFFVGSACFGKRTFLPLNEGLPDNQKQAGLE
jgi:hypothetical protein